MIFTLIIKSISRYPSSLFISFELEINVIAKLHIAVLFKIKVRNTFPIVIRIHITEIGGLGL